MVASAMRIGLSAGMIQGGKSGVAQYVFGLLEGLCARSDCPELVVFVLEGDAALFDFVAGRARLHLVSERFRPALRNIFWHQIRLPKLAVQLGLDAIHVPSYRRLLWPKPCALVGTIHDLAPFRMPDKYDLSRMLYGRVVARWLARRQDAIIAVSRHTAADIREFFGISGDRLQVIVNGIDHARFYPGDPVRAREEVAVKWALNRPYFFYLSRLEHPAKNHVRLLHAFERFKTHTRSDWQLVLAGSDWHGASVIHAAARNSLFRHDIRFLGFAPDGDVPSLYRGAVATVYPSLFEGFGFPPVEAMACGCPVLSSKGGALAEVVGDAAGRLDPEDVEQMECALTRAATDSAWRADLRAEGLRNAQRFSWQTNAEEVLRCYVQTVKAAGRAHVNAEECLGR